MSNTRIPYKSWVQISDQVDMSGPFSLDDMKALNKSGNATASAPPKTVALQLNFE